MHFLELSIFNDIKSIKVFEVNKWENRFILLGRNQLETVLVISLRLL
jgi:hypothetical protein